ncbi:hypothetical protein SEA_CECE_320 [Microbacterium phage Cece]|nr:hypothetical protein SEA_CECE_18 [Microbacterium phage Cece]UVG35326.1 hypothetical protein SEA_CECE_320 [Microbacterium phage Cece]
MTTNEPIPSELDGDVIDTGKRDGLEIVWRDTATLEEWVDGSTDVWDATNSRTVEPGWSR